MIGAPVPPRCAVSPRPSTTALSVALWLGACVPADTDPAGDTDPDTDEIVDPDTDFDTDSDTLPPLPPPDPACKGPVLAVRATDPWGRDLAATIDVAVPDRVALGAGAAWWARPGLVEAVELAAVDHHDAAITVRWAGAAPEVVGLDRRSRWAVTRNVVDVGGLECEVHTTWVGLDHHWFSPSAPPPSRNRATVLFDGEEGWQAVSDLLSTATTRVTWSTWYWESELELVRPPGHERMTESQRRRYTALAALQALPNVDRRVLINRFWGENLDFTAYLNTDAELRAYAETPGDRFEVMLQGNLTSVPLDEPFTAVPTPYSYLARVRALRPEERAVASDVPGASRGWFAVDAASWHQKGIVVDGARAVVTGMNTKSSDWDTVAHDVFDPRRMPFDASVDERLDVAAREEPSEIEPRKDFSVLLEGPAAADVEATFISRWAQGRASGALYADRSTALPALARPAEPPGGVPVQVVVTTPEPALQQQILETQLRALEQATDYVIIEDQYFRAPVLAEVLERRMWEERDLKLLVITNEVSEWDPAAQWTIDNDQRFRVFGDRYLTIQLVATDLYTDPGYFWDTVELIEAPIFVHSKLRLVDDRYLSVGSCNWNNRGYKYEGELNVAILDPGLARATRRRLLAQIAGPAWAPFLSDDMENNLAVLALAAEDNAELAEWWDETGEDLDADEAERAWAAYRTSGWAFPLSFPEDWTWDVGPDVF